MIQYRESVPSERVWSTAAYSRAVRVGDVIEVAGTSASDPDGTVLSPGDMYGQTRDALAIIIASVERLGGNVSDIVRTRIFLTDIDLWAGAAQAHSEVFGHLAHPPVSAIYGISALLDPGLLVEIEATAIAELKPGEGAEDEGP